MLNKGRLLSASILNAPRCQGLHQLGSGLKGSNQQALDAGISACSLERVGEVAPLSSATGLASTVPLTEINAVSCMGLKALDVARAGPDVHSLPFPVGTNIADTVLVASTHSLTPIASGPIQLAVLPLTAPVEGLNCSRNDKLVVPLPLITPLVCCGNGCYNCVLLESLDPSFLPRLD